MDFESLKEKFKELLKELSSLLIEGLPDILGELF